MKKNKDYVVITELPEEEQTPFVRWLAGQTRPLIEAEKENKWNCAYAWDYKCWKEGRERFM